MSARHPAWTGLLWAVRVWLLGSLVLAAIYIAIPLLELARRDAALAAARRRVAPGQHAPKPRQAVTLGGGPVTKPTKAVGS